MDPGRLGQPSPERCRADAIAALEGKPVSAQRETDQQSLRSLYECRVVALDDDAACSLISPAIKANCEAFYHFFHLARRATASVRWPDIMANALKIECGNPFGGFPEEVCSSLQEAVAAQNVQLCSSMPQEMNPFCEAMASSDPKRCADADCAELAERLRILARGGLQQLTREGTARDQLHARAALQGISACNELIDLHVQQCTAQ